MIVVLDVNYLEVPDEKDMIELVRTDLQGDVFTYEGQPVDYKVYAEAVRGVRYVRRDGTEVRIGYSEKAAECLGVSAKIIADLEYDVMVAEKSLKRQQQANLTLINQKQRLEEDCEGLKTDKAWQGLQLECTRNQYKRVLKANFWTRLKWLFTGVK